MSHQCTRLPKIHTALCICSIPAVLYVTVDSAIFKSVLRGDLYINVYCIYIRRNS